MEFDLTKLEKIAEGKTKRVFRHPTDSGLYVLEFKDDITAGDGAKHDVMEGKGKINCETSSRIMGYLNNHGIPTHFVEQAGDNLQIVLAVDMVPIELIARERAYGSLIKRFPFFKKGQKLKDISFELSYKNDAAHDPLINEELAVLGGLLKPGDYKKLKSLTRDAFKILGTKFGELEAELVDYKIEAGKPKNNVPAHKQYGFFIVSDELTNDSWRVWPGGKETDMIDKQLYRDTGDVNIAKLGYDKMLELVRKV